ncbi:VOC family protein [Knoellia subterranea]|uniref:VOC family protein n=1 Tax=Knoellia subterranea TaxID=184882 RepID=UPI00055BCBBB|nr:VOC family protein [Knoellia subterranea]
MNETLRIELFPSDVERSAAFCASLGFAISGLGDEPVAYAVARLGAVSIGLCRAQPVNPAARAVPSGTEIVIDVDDVDATWNAVVARGVDPAEDLVDRPWGLRDFRVHDPDGYYRRFTNRRG